MSDTEITVIVDYQTALDTMTKRGKDLYTKVRNAVIQQQQALYTLIQQKLDGQVLNVRTGKLRRSIQRSSILEGYGVIAGYVYSDSSVRYGAIHEFGGTIHHPGGTAYWIDASGMMRFVSNDMASRVHSGEFPRTRPHDIVMPERSFMRSALREREADIRAALAEAVKPE